MKETEECPVRYALEVIGCLGQLYRPTQEAAHHGKNEATEAPPASITAITLLSDDGG